MPVIACAPPPRPLVVQSAAPPESALASQPAIAVPSLRKLTVPVGVDAPEMRAVKVTLWPASIVYDDESIVAETGPLPPDVFAGVPLPVEPPPVAPPPVVVEPPPVGGGAPPVSAVALAAAMPNFIAE